MSATVTTTLSKEWKRRMLIITLIAFAGGAWFLFDGLWAWPRNNERWEVFAGLRQQYGERTQELEKAWLAAAQERGWGNAIPKKFYGSGDLLFQKVLGVAALLAALSCLRNYFSSQNASLSMEDEVIHLPDGRRVPLEKVQAVSLRRWENKGIADVAYAAPDGTSKKFPLDDYKYAGAVDILKAVQKQLGEESSATSEEEVSEQAPESGNTTED